MQRSLRRIVVAGVSGSGKTTLCRRIAKRLSVEHVELDALHHGPNWTPRPEFVDDVRAFLARDAWVTEYQYPSVRPLLLERAELLVWLDIPTWQTMYQVTSRTLLRRLQQTELWNGNIEPPLYAFFSDPEHVVRLAWLGRHKLRQQLPQVLRQYPTLTQIRLRSHADAAYWLKSL